MKECDVNHDQLRANGHSLCWTCREDLGFPAIERIAAALEKLVKLTEDAVKTNRELLEIMKKAQEVKP